MAIADEVRRANPPVAPLGLSRAKLYAFHAAIATSVAGIATGACGGQTTTSTDAGSVMDARSGDGTSGDVESVDAAESGGQDASADTSTVADAGTDQGIADTRPDWGPPPPPYGCVFPEGCGDVKV
jgi:hypothetical protein